MLLLQYLFLDFLLMLLLQYLLFDFLLMLLLQRLFFYFLLMLLMQYLFFDFLIMLIKICVCSTTFFENWYGLLNTDIWAVLPVVLGPAQQCCVVLCEMLCASYVETIFMQMIFNYTSVHGLQPKPTNLCLQITSYRGIDKKNYRGMAVIRKTQMAKSKIKNNKS